MVSKVDIVPAISRSRIKCGKETINEKQAEKYLLILVGEHSKKSKNGL